MGALKAAGKRSSYAGVGVWLGEGYQSLTLGHLLLPQEALVEVDVLQQAALRQRFAPGVRLALQKPGGEKRGTGTLAVGDFTASHTPLKLHSPQHSQDGRLNRKLLRDPENNTTNCAIHTNTIKIEQSFSKDQ